MNLSSTLIRLPRFGDLSSGEKYSVTVLAAMASVIFWLTIASVMECALISGEPCTIWSTYTFTNLFVILLLLAGLLFITITHSSRSAGEEDAGEKDAKER